MTAKRGEEELGTPIGVSEFRSRAGAGEFDQAWLSVITYLRLPVGTCYVAKGSERSHSLCFGLERAEQHRRGGGARRPREGAEEPKAPQGGSNAKDEVHLEEYGSFQEAEVSVARYID